MLGIFVDYLFVLKYISIVVLAVVFLFGLDDLFIDVYYWVRTIKRKFTVYKHNKHSNPDDLFKPEQSPIAILVPAWQEVGVVGPMVQAAAKSLDYENYEIFVGTYPNDSGTQSDVDDVCAHFEHVHKVVCALPGPTSKADCLNNIISSIIEFEKDNQIEFQGFVLHDSEDMISPLELRLFNYLLKKNDLIQVPVYPYTKHWYEMTAAHYIDEFAEAHGKDVVVREAISGQVPSAGVGTCFSRKAILKLLLEGDGLAFDTKSLTEDYDIGFRLKKWGMREIFVRYAVNEKDATLREKDRRFTHDRENRVICVREYFPSKFKLAVRQKARWIVGIVFQGFRTHKWVKDKAINYFLWRDRRGALSNIFAFIAMILFLQLTLIYVYQLVVPDSYHFLSIFGDDIVIQTLLITNMVLFVNRMLQRLIFVTQYYGLKQGWLSIVRMVWGNFINFFAVLRAIRLVMKAKGSRNVAWDKTTHHFPHVMEPRKQPIGQILLEHGLVSEVQLEAALLSKPAGIRLGLYLIAQNLVTPSDIGKVLADNAELLFERIDPFELDNRVIKQIDKSLALKYMVMPLHFYPEEQRLIVGLENKPNPVALAAISRATGLSIEPVIVQPGAVNIGVRYWYLGDSNVHPKRHLSLDNLPDNERSLKLDKYFALHESLGQILINMNLISPSALKQVSLEHYRQKSELRFGDNLVRRGVLSDEQVQIALAEQKRRLEELVSA